MIELTSLKKPIPKFFSSFKASHRFNELKIPKPPRYVSGRIEGEELQEKLAQARRNANRNSWIE